MKQHLFLEKQILDPVEGVKFISVKTAEEMFRETLSNLPTDVAIFNAAVADFKVKEIKSEKIKKSEYLDLKLEKNIDILSNISNHNSLRPKLQLDLPQNHKILR